MSAGQLVLPDTALRQVAIDPADRAELARALDLLDRGPGLLVRMADLMGGVMGRTMTIGARTLGLAPALDEKLQGIAAVALQRAFDVAVLGLADASLETVSRNAVRQGRVSRAVVTLSGAVGGFLGMAGFVPDAAVTTLTIMRDIASIAQQEGESLADPDTRRACLHVFALSREDGGGESEWSYLSARLMMRGRPLAMLFSDAAARYGISLSKKFALQAMPIIGAVGGAALNGAFLSHYRDVGRAHFKIRRLGRQYGEVAVEHAIAELRSKEKRA